MADSPLEFRPSKGRPIVINAVAPNNSPHVVWSPIGGLLGTIVVSDADKRSVFTNRAGGDPDNWEEHATPARAVYSRATQIFKKKPDHLSIYGGVTYDWACTRHSALQWSVSTRCCTQMQRSGRMYAGVQ